MSYLYRLYRQASETPSQRADRLKRLTDYEARLKAAEEAERVREARQSAGRKEQKEQQ